MRETLGATAVEGSVHTYATNEAPPAILELTRELLPRLLEGDVPQLAALRAQADRTTVVRMEYDGSGFFVHLAVPAELPPVVPAYMAGGDATISLDAGRLLAGCVLFVREGRLALLDLYAHHGSWPEDAADPVVTDVFPLIVPEP